MIHESNVEVSWDESFLLSDFYKGDFTVTLEQVLEKLQSVKRRAPRLKDEIAGCESYATVFNANQQSLDCYVDMMRSLHDLSADLDSIHEIDLYDEVNDLIDNIRNECLHFYDDSFVEYMHYHEQ